MRKLFKMLNQKFHHIVVDHLIIPVLKFRVENAWKKSKINRFNRNKIIIPCPYCGSQYSKKISTWFINDHFGLFEDSYSRMKIIYALDATSKFFMKNNLEEYRKKIIQWISGNAFVDYYLCSNCGLVYQNYPHLPQNANYYYRDLYRLIWQTRGINAEPVYGRNDERWIYQQEAIPKYFLESTQLKKNSKILDLGCAEGIGCKYLLEHDMMSYGLEPSAPMANYARNVLGLNNILCEEYTIDSYQADFFDGIYSHHVAEHVVDINGFFNGIQKHLKKDGFFLLQVPCFDNLKLKKDIDLILQGGHVYCFSEKFLVSLLEQLDFTILDIKKTPCNLNELPTEQIGKWETTVWADDPCGITILARKQ